MAACLLCWSLRGIWKWTLNDCYGKSTFFSSGPASHKSKIIFSSIVPLDKVKWEARFVLQPQGDERIRVEEVVPGVLSHPPPKCCAESLGSLNTVRAWWPGAGVLLQAPWDLGLSCERTFSHTFIVSPGATYCFQIVFKPWTSHSRPLALAKHSLLPHSSLLQPFYLVTVHKHTLVCVCVHTCVLGICCMLLGGPRWPRPWGHCNEQSKSFVSGSLYGGRCAVKDNKTQADKWIDEFRWL